MEAAVALRARSGLSWSGVIAGVLTAIAITSLVVALGSGIGLSLASPYSYSPSSSTLTLIGAVWLVFSQALGFAAGGYIAGRLRRDPLPFHAAEVKFRDGANGLTVWAIGAVVSVIVIAAVIDKAGSVATSAASGTAQVAVASATQAPSLDYFTDSLLRTNSQNGSAVPANNAERAQINRVMLTALTPGGLSADDRSYLGQIVSARTGLSADDAQKRVDDVVKRAEQDAKEVADTARKAAAYLSFWTFMSLLFGAACATLGGILGGELRDESAIRASVVTSPR
jgi:hypothetical protein